MGGSAEHAMASIVGELSRSASARRWGYLHLNEASLLDAIALAEERGAWAAVRRYLGCKEALHLDASAEPSLAAHMRELRARLAEAEAYEAVHGQGSLRKPDHPFNIRMDAMMRRLRESQRRVSSES
ncbi:MULTISPECIES: hypothetical protein [Roseomonas]|uniref:hypothetical protein n=1 Tax=Roseomonas TaxID=125216 RepID=UPI0028CEB965|nr:hypothetical protein [Roseomonas mucosa]MDT8312732.1 hypothetical protein [Roseomonas mucosa]MDT8351180.1 hypothetical protein [Roseomonas mucosa]MDT8360115.1 hypothetical protein [Roseomonas mucosa]